MERVKPPQLKKKEYPGYDTKMHEMVRFQYLISGKYQVTPSLSLFPGSLRLKMGIHVWVPYMGEIFTILETI